MNFKTTKEANNKRLEVLVYGASGVGKTNLVSTIDDEPSKVLIIDFDNGTFGLRGKDYCLFQPKSIAETLNLLMELKKDNPFRWVVLDALSEMSSSFLNELKNKHRDTRQSYMEMGDLVKQVIALVRSLDCNKYFISHADQVQDDAGVLLYSPALEGNALKQKLPQYFDIVACLRIFKKDDGEVVRALQCKPDADPRYITKDRSGSLEGYEKPSIKGLWDKIYPEFTSNKAKIKLDAKAPEPKPDRKPETKTEKEVAKTFPGSTFEDVYNKMNVPDGDCKLEINGKTWMGTVSQGCFVFPNGEEKSLSGCPDDAKFIV